MRFRPAVSTYIYIYLHESFNHGNEGPTYLPTWLQIPLWTLQLVSQHPWNSQTAETCNHHNTWPVRSPLPKLCKYIWILLKSLCELVTFSCISLIYSSPWGHKVSGAHLISNHIADCFCFFVHCKFQLDAFSFVRGFYDSLFDILTAWNPRTLEPRSLSNS